MQNIRNHSKTGTHLIFTAGTNEDPAEDYKHIHCKCQPREKWNGHIKKYWIE